MTTETEAEQALWRIKRGDNWRRGWTGVRSEGDTSVWDADTLLVQTRRGPVETDTLIASSDSDDVPGEDEDNPVVLIDTAGTDFSGDPLDLRLHITNSDTESVGFVPEWNVWTEAQCEIDGDVKTFMKKNTPIEGQVAVQTEEGS